MSTATSTASSSTYELDFERPLIQLERQLSELENHADENGVNINAELRKLRSSHTAMLKKIYGKLSAWNTVKVARHPDRPQSVDYLRMCFKDFCELHGDRRYADDNAIVTGFARVGPYKCMVVAQAKGKDVKERIKCNFGMPHPEGYRKALLKMKLAEKYNLPVVTLVDTPGAYPGVGAEERGQAEAIAYNLQEMSRLKVPVLSIVIGEGGSGGALGIGVADRVAMLQYAWYSVISPEGCSSILWKTGDKAPEAAEALKITAAENLKRGIVDEVIDEPLGGAHRNVELMGDRVQKWIVQNLRELKRFKVENLVSKRYDRLRALGTYTEE
ncbi:MAG TPA: acetyl-CoA carboxylase carboxyl transferase subunit alpha [Phycisphaerales bacterium]|nr:acetyl-CoA carboxylase carboxyl transferase subunit alpha [Phycisphaerales bacterium]HCD31205.1 acetyl-CoA carboxylase carboxyl transferase subunit alpha [Phycisphaerales bacterium]|tara:strand:+ start:197 stop:1183 length:987 start_codon:yes stop_codon:yes gene_type:complete